jgi:hypothetical protein
MTLLDRVVCLLGERDVRHALIGAAALAAHGIARSTYDIDLLTTDERVLGDEFWSGLRSEGPSADVRRGDDQDPLRGVVRVELADERPVDIIVGRHPWHARAVDRARQLADAPPVVTARDLILLKLYAGGTQDVWDVRELLRLPNAAELVDEVSADLADLPAAMRELWWRHVLQRVDEPPSRS